MLSEQRRSCGPDYWGCLEELAHPKGFEPLTSAFQTITRGFASVDESNVAVCLLPGTELAFEKEVQCDTAFVFRSARQLGHKVAMFRQVDKGRSNVHHDALELPDGKIVLLTQLCEGQHATVLQLPASPRVTVDDSLVV